MKIYNYSKLIIFIVFSVLLFVFRNELVVDLHYFVASVMLAFGLESIGVLFFVKKKDAIKTIRFAFAVTELVVGLTLMFAIRHFITTCVIWAMWSILRQSIDIHEVLCGRVKGVMAIIYIVQSITSMVFSILLMLEPSEHHAISHIYLLIAELIVISVPPVVEEILSATGKRKKEEENS